jgi:hypothetical protein
MMSCDAISLIYSLRMYDKDVVVVPLVIHSRLNLKGFPLGETGYASHEGPV